MFKYRYFPTVMECIGLPKHKLRSNTDKPQIYDSMSKNGDVINTQIQERQNCHHFSSILAKVHCSREET